MEKTLQDRRRFLADAGLAAAAMICGGATAGHAAQPGGGLHVAINQWSVGAVRGRDKQKARVSFDEELAELAASGINGLEPAVGSADQVGPLAAQLKEHGLELRSIFTGSALDDRAKVGKEVERIVALAKSAKEAGTRIIVTNPSPLPNRQGKSDEQLKTQAAALDTLGHKLAAIGVTLAYHNHDVELQYAAREFHHMMLGTDPRAEPVSRRPLGLSRRRPFSGGFVRCRQTLRLAHCGAALAAVDRPCLERDLRRRGHRLS